MNKDILKYDCSKIFDDYPILQAFSKTNIPDKKSGNFQK